MFLFKVMGSHHHSTIHPFLLNHSHQHSKMPLFLLSSKQQQKCSLSWPYFLCRLLSISISLHIKTPWKPYLHLLFQARSFHFPYTYFSQVFVPNDSTKTAPTGSSKTSMLLHPMAYPQTSYHLSATFQTVHHSLLLETLFSPGFQDSTLLIFFLPH